MHLLGINTLYVQTGTISLILTLVSTCLLHSINTYKVGALAYTVLIAAHQGYSSIVLKSAIDRYPEC